jgi:hypothetical protein
MLGDIGLGTTISRMRGTTHNVKDLVARRGQYAPGNITAPYVKQGSVMRMPLNPEDVQRGLRIKRSLEKTASPRALSSFFSSTMGAAAGVAKKGEKEVSSRAALGDLARHALLATALGTGIGVAAPLIMYGVGKALKAPRAATLNRDYKAMLAVDPSLKEDPKALQYFSVLHRASPYVAGEPIIAATVVSNMVRGAGLDVKKFKDILDLEKAHQEAEMPWFRHKSGGADKGLFTAMGPS